MGIRTPEIVIANCSDGRTCRTFLDLMAFRQPLQLGRWPRQTHFDVPLNRLLGSQRPSPLRSDNPALLTPIDPLALLPQFVRLNRIRAGICCIRDDPMGRGKPTFVSLFCGCGGFDLGFTQAGYRCVGAYDVDPEAITVYRRNLSKAGRIVDLSVEEPEIGCETPGVVIAGPPCQGFSTAGKRKLNDARNSLLVTAARLATRLSPKIIVIENVAGVIAGAHRKYWDDMIGHLRSEQFKTAELRCDAADYGVPQVRKRMLCVAWKSQFDGAVELPTRPGGSLRDAISRINGASNHERKILDPASKAALIAKRIAPGEKLCNVRASARSVHTWNIPEVYGRTNQWERTVLETLLRRRRQQRVRNWGDADPVSAQALRHAVGKPVAETLRSLIRKRYVRRIEKQYDLVHTFNGKFRRLSWDKPAPTVDTKFGDPYYFLHPEENRAFTVREAARVQGFPDNFVFAGGLGQQYKLVGNAVPPPLACELALFLRNHLL